MQETEYTTNPQLNPSPVSGSTQGAVSVPSSDSTNNQQRSDQLIAASGTNTSVASDGQNDSVDPDFVSSDEVDELNRSLGMVVPEDVLTEMIPVWKKFFYMIRKMLSTDSIQVDQIPGFLVSFKDIPDGDKIETMNTIYNRYLKFLDESEVMKDMWHAQDIQEAYEEFVALIPEKERDRILYYIETGEDVDIDEVNAKIAELKSYLSEDSQNRLNAYITGKSGGFRVDSDSERSQYQTSVRRGGSVLDPDELEQRLSVTEEPPVGQQPQSTIPVRPARAPQAPSPRQSSPNNSSPIVPPARVAPTLEALTQRKNSLTNSPSRPTQPATNTPNHVLPQQGQGGSKPVAKIPGGKQKPSGTLEDLLNN